ARPAPPDDSRMWANLDRPEMPPKEHYAPARSEADKSSTDSNFEMEVIINPDGMVNTPVLMSQNFVTAGLTVRPPDVLNEPTTSAPKTTASTLAYNPLDLPSTDDSPEIKNEQSSSPRSASNHPGFPSWSSRASLKSSDDQTDRELAERFVALAVRSPEFGKEALPQVNDADLEHYGDPGMALVWRVLKEIVKNLGTEGMQQPGFEAWFRSRVEHEISRELPAGQPALQVFIFDGQPSLWHRMFGPGSQDLMIEHGRDCLAQFCTRRILQELKLKLGQANFFGNDAIVQELEIAGRRLSRLKKKAAVVSSFADEFASYQQRTEGLRGKNLLGLKTGLAT